MFRGGRDHCSSCLRKQTWLIVSVIQLMVLSVLISDRIHSTRLVDGFSPQTVRILILATGQHAHARKIKIKMRIAFLSCILLLQPREGSHHCILHAYVHCLCIERARALAFHWIGMSWLYCYDAKDNKLKKKVIHLKQFPKETWQRQQHVVNNMSYLIYEQSESLRAVRCVFWQSGGVCWCNCELN